MVRSAFCALALLFAVPSFAEAPLQASLQHLADRARPARLGIIVMDPTTGSSTQVNGEHPFMMMSTFKAPVAAAVLAQVEQGRLTLSQTVRLGPADVIEGSAVRSLGERLKKGPADVSVDELLSASVTQSDNTAVDALVRLAGGGHVISAWLREKGVAGMRIDLGEGDFGKSFDRLGYAKALDAPENTTTLEGAATFLRKLQGGELLSPASTTKLLGLMTSQVIPNRIRAGLPAGYSIADKTGTGPTVDGRLAAWNDIGIVTAPDGRKMIVAAFLRDSTATQAEREALFGDLGRLVAARLK